MRQERHHIDRIFQFITRLLVISQKLPLNTQIEIPPNKRISVANYRYNYWHTFRKADALANWHNIRGNALL